MAQFLSLQLNTVALGPNLKISLEKVIVAFVLISFGLTSTGLLIANQGPVTREEAIEISGNSKLVQNLLQDADRYSLELHYLNKTQSPTGHGIWSIRWYIHPTGTASSVLFVVIHEIAGETGQITREELGGSR